MTINANLVAACQLFAQQFRMPGYVYYPACGNDSSPSAGFPDADIVYLDIEPRGLAEIRRETPFKQTDTHEMPAQLYQPPSPFDVVVSVHSHAPFDAEIKFLKVGGHLIMADKGVDKAFDHHELELVAALPWKTDRNEDGLARIETDDLAKYLEVVPLDRKPTFASRRKVKAGFYVFRKK